ncbi:helix-turn-helix domain-containing protein [Maridesulfovibrio sp.]|uniref:helix-turn-helix domain-containing protein n=1 Tax=Maridesulfovibrio sp. TaxID=2795000 RepID=UPI003BAAF0B7
MERALIKDLPLYALLCRPSGEISFYNKAFERLIQDNSKPINISEICTTEFQPLILNKLHECLAAGCKLNFKFETSLFTTNTILITRAIPLKSNDQVCLIFDNLNIRHKLECSLLQNLHTPQHDCFWILNSKLEVTYMHPTPACPLQMSASPFNIYDAFPASEHSMLRQNLTQARLSPYELTPATLTIISPEGNIETELNTLYAPDPFYNDRYLCALNSGHSTARQIISRLRIAFNVEKDSQLAKKLGVSPPAIAAAKKKNRVPDSWLMNCYRQCRASVQWLDSGRGSMYIK